VVDHPKTDKIAIKVINHYGDEVLKVYEVQGSAWLRWILTETTFTHY